MQMSKYISLWSGPRNISTTLMYSFAQRSDTKVIDEPLYAHYLATSPARSYHPGAEQVLKEQNNNGNVVLEDIFLQNEFPVYFLKNMAHHLKGINQSYLSKMLHVLLIRHPKDVLLSYSKVISNIDMNDVGYEIQWELKEYLDRHHLPYIVLDAKHVLLNPEEQLKTTCQFLDIPFQKQMIYWDKGPISEDGSWAKYWYSSIHKSTGFLPYKEKNEEIPSHLLSLYKKCNVVYQKLRNIALD